MPRGCRGAPQPRRSAARPGPVGGGAGEPAPCACDLQPGDVRSADRCRQCAASARASALKRLPLYQQALQHRSRGRSRHTTTWAMRIWSWPVCRGRRLLPARARARAATESRRYLCNLGRCRHRQLGSAARRPIAMLPAPGSWQLRSRHRCRRAQQPGQRAARSRRAPRGRGAVPQGHRARSRSAPKATAISEPYCSSSAGSRRRWPAFARPWRCSPTMPPAHARASAFGAAPAASSRRCGGELPGGAGDRSRTTSKRCRCSASCAPTAGSLPRPRNYSGARSTINPDFAFGVLQHRDPPPDDARRCRAGCSGAEALLPKRAAARHRRSACATRSASTSTTSGSTSRPSTHYRQANELDQALWRRATTAQS